MCMQSSHNSLSPAYYLLIVIITFKQCRKGRIGVFWYTVDSTNSTADVGIIQGNRIRHDVSDEAVPQWYGRCREPPAAEM